MIGFYDYTMWLTYLGLLSSVCGIWLALSGSPLYAIFCLLFSGFCDMFDGKVARSKKDRTEMQKKYGIQLDSLSDLVCFGVLPAVIGYFYDYPTWLYLPLALFYVLNGMIRLAYFNVTEEERQKTTSEVRHMYTGVPITTAALVFPFAFGIQLLCGGKMQYFYAFMMFLTGFGFVFPVQIHKPKTKGLIIMTVLGVLILAGLLILQFGLA